MKEINGNIKVNIFTRILNYVYSLLPFKKIKTSIENKLTNNKESINKLITISIYTYPIYITAIIGLNLNFLYSDKVPDFGSLKNESDFQSAIGAFNNEMFMLHDDSLKSQYRKIAIKESKIKHRQDNQGEAELFSYGRENIGIYKGLTTNTFMHREVYFKQIMNIPDYLFTICYENYAGSQKPYENMYKCVNTISVSINIARESLKAKNETLKIEDTIFMYENSIEVFQEEKTIEITKGIDYGKSSN
jgi:hypothetical protein